MSVLIADFWKLLVDSRLLSVQQCQQLNNNFQSVKGADTQGNAKTLAHWLISLNHITPYQATILLGGRCGPFFYGDYKIYDRVGDGRLEGYFRAIHSPTGHPVLIQFMPNPASPEQWPIAARQAMAHCEIRHPNLNQCHEPVDLVSYRFVVMEDLQGQAVDNLLRRHGPLNAAEACRFVRLTSLGLSRLHQQGHVHGDIRPWNIWAEPTGNIKLLRDPFETPVAPDFAQPHAGLLSKADYLAPEFTQPGKQPDERTDVYALGCSFYEMLTGRPPFPGGDAPQKLGRHAAEPIQPLEPFGVPQPIAQMVTYMMAKNPGVRYQKIDSVIEQLNTYVAPANLQPRPQSLAPTLHSFEHWIKQKQDALAKQPPAPRADTTGVPSSTSSPIAANQAVAAVTANAAVAPLGNLVDATNSGEPESVRVSVNSSPGAVASVAGSAPALQESREKRRAKTLAIWLSATAGVLVLALILFKAFSNNEKDVAQSQQDPESPTVETETPQDEQGSAASRPVEGEVSNRLRAGTPANPSNANGGELTPTAPTRSPMIVTEVVDDASGKLLWASPTAGEPIRFHYVPPDSRLFIVARLSAIQSSRQGPLLLQALGPVFADSLSDWQRDAGVVVGDVKQVIMSLHAQGDAFPKPAFVVHLTRSVPKEKLLSRWGNPSPSQVGSATIYSGRNYSYYMPRGEDVATFLMGSPQNVKDVASVGGVSPPLQREIGALRRASDDQRHVTILAQPQFLSSNVLRDGRNWYFGQPTSVRNTLEWFLGDGVKACMLSAHFDGVSFVELRAHGSVDVRNQTRAEQLKGKLQELPNKVRDYVVKLVPHPYWEMVRIQYPQMIRAMNRYARTGVEGEHAIVNCVLPESAGHNLVFGTEMVLTTPKGPPPTTVTPPPAKPKTMQEILASKISLSFGQDSLEFSMRNVMDEVKGLQPDFEFRIRILGEDLKLDGITRNQQIRDFKQDDKTVAEVLTALVMKANPITTVKSPTEPDQKLLWVVGPDPDDGQESILITTRQVAAQKYDIPKEFRAP